jgi:hypothetical protein
MGLGSSAREGSCDLLIDCLSVASCILPLPGVGCLLQLANELIAHDPDPFLDLGKNLLVRRPEAWPFSDVGGQGLHGLLRRWAFELVGRIAGIDLVGPPVEFHEEGTRKSLSDAEENQQPDG